MGGLLAGDFFLSWPLFSLGEPRQVIRLVRNVDLQLQLTITEFNLNNSGLGIETIVNRLNEANSVGFPIDDSKHKIIISASILAADARKESLPFLPALLS